MSDARDYLCYTDGSCKAAEGAPGGWGFVIKTPEGATLEGHGHAIGTLAKVMEYRAVAEALEALAGFHGARATVFCDNEPLVQNLSARLDAWVANGFANVDGTIADSVRRIADARTRGALVVRYQWIRAHNGNTGNERADALAAQGAREAKAMLVGRRGPGA